ncbi:phage portal protein [Paenibacillus planticolens]|uniref:Phage portal protein n=1 Tax=Paenibacillus planticolens TaxID=2654976 RepID=A0ABX1ZEF7_9BACL|nr:phage portal protein [Paenibacillus planticolens]NOU98471.1 phage portal protein [Paenibacillus planticolens]
MFPPPNEIERLSKYYRGRKIFDGKQYEIVQRMSDLLKDTPHAKQLDKLYMAVNIMDVLLTKPADMLVGEPPTYDSGKGPDSTEQDAVNSIVEENDLNQLIHELTVGAGIRGDSFIKEYYGYRQDFSEVPGGVPEGIAKEPIIEAVNPAYVFPELSHHSAKKFKAINIATVEWVVSQSDGEVPFLNVERHVPGFIIYERYKLSGQGVDNSFGAPILTFMVGDRVATGRDNNVEETGVPRLLVQHIPYKSVDDYWSGISGIEKIESILAAINDALVQLDYILHKHSDPTAYGPALDGTDVRIGGKYIPVEKTDVTPGYMAFLSSQQLDGIFKELDLLIGLVFQMSETPQWLFGTQISGGSDGGTGTSHSDGGAIKARFMPVLTKVKRIRSHVDRAIRDAIYNAQLLENFANDGVDGFSEYESVYPKIMWKDGIPRDEKAEAETMQIRTGGHATIDVKTAIKRMDGIDDSQADEIMTRIEDDTTRVNGTVDSTIFNGGGA